MVWDSEKICLHCALPSMQEGKCTICGQDEEISLKKEREEVLAPGTLLRGRYLLGRAIGCGGFGITYIAVDLQAKKRIAIKECFHYNVCRRGDNERKVVLTSEENRREFADTTDRFLKEANLLKENSDNPGIIQIYEVFEENDTVYYTMEFLEGTDLKSYLAQKGDVLSWKETQELLEPIFNSLISLHRFNIWHRDISPDNIFVCKNGEVRLIDFGSARMGILGKSHDVDVAKKGYAPVEQYNDEWEQGTWTDVYAMAATVYRCLTGVVPPAAICRLRRDEYAAPSKYAKEIPEYVDNALYKGLEVLPQYRFRTMAELKCALYEESKTLPLADRIVEMPPATQETREYHVRLVGLEGYYKGKEIPVKSTVIMGRREDACTVIFPAYMPGVSGVHLSIRWDEARKMCVLRDLNSTYGIRNLGGVLFERGVDIYLTEGEGFIVGDDNIFAILF